MDLRFFITFIEVSKTRHFSKAAENLYLTPAAVSARIKQLEEYFNTALFTRERNSIQLTPAGKKLLPYANEMANSLKHARDALSTQDIEFIVWGATPNAVNLLWETLFSACNTIVPKAAIRSEIQSSEQLSRQLHERTIDFAFTTEPLKSTDIESIAFCEHSLYLYKAKPANSDNKASFVDVLWSAKVNTNDFSRTPIMHDYHMDPYHMKTNDVRVGISYVNQYGGAIILPEKLAHTLNNAEKTEIAIATLTLYCVRLKERPATLTDNIIAYLQNSQLP